MKYLLTLAIVAVIAVPAFAQTELAINEVFASMTGTDYDEYIELCGPPDMALDGYAVLIVEGDSGTTLASHPM